MLNVGGRVEVITFHSLEDKIVKKYFKEVCSIDDKIKGLPNIPKEYLPDFKLVVNKAIIPTDKELENNNLDYAYSPIRGYNANRFSTKEKDEEKG